MSSESASNPAPAPSKPSYSTDPALYIYTSLTAGSSHIVTATSRLETILRANKVPFKAIDLATDEKARMLWGRRSGKDESGRVRKLPGLVQEGTILGDLVEIEDWNEYGELKQHVKIYYDEFTQPSISQKPKAPVVVPKPVHPFAAAVAAASASSSTPTSPPAAAPKKPEPTKTTLPIRSIAEEAAQKAKQVHLQSLRDKVYGKGGAPPKEGEDKKKDEVVEEATPPAGKENKESPAAAPATPPATEASSSARGLQSPTTGGWKDESTLPTIQSPKTTSWKPTDIDAPITTYLGSVVAAASAEEIAAIERAETIEEEEEEDDDSEEGSEEDSSEEEEEEEDEKDKKEVKK